MPLQHLELTDAIRHRLAIVRRAETLYEQTRQHYTAVEIVRAEFAEEVLAAIAASEERQARLDAIEPKPLAAGVVEVGLYRKQSS